MRMKTLLGIIVGMLLCGSVVGGDGQWPSFHGAARDNKSTETGLLKKWPADGPKLLWTATGLGKGYSTVTVAGGMIYTAGMIDKQTHVLAFDLAGKPKWSKPNGPSWQARQRFATRYVGSRSTPTYDAGRVYHLGGTGRLAALDAKSGAEIWQVDLMKRFGARAPNWGATESVLIDGDGLICTPGGAKGHVVRLAKATGKLVWANTEVSGVGYASHVIAEFGGHRQVLGVNAKIVYGIDIKTGKLLWSSRHGKGLRNNATDAVFHKGHVLVASGYGGGSAVVKLTAAAGAIKAEKVWAKRLMDNHHGGIVRVDDHVYGSGHQSKGWFCLDLLAGKQAWKAPGKGASTYADGMLYCLDEKGTMSLVEATPKEYRLAGSFRVPSGGSGLHWAHPVVCGGRLYVRHADKLFAYDIRAGAK